MLLDQQQLGHEISALTCSCTCKYTKEQENRCLQDAWPLDSQITSEPPLDDEILRALGLVYEKPKYGPAINKVLAL